MYVVTAYYNKYVRNKNDKNTYRCVTQSDCLLIRNLCLAECAIRRVCRSELGRMLGCTYENVRDPTWDAYTTLMTPWMYASTGVITTEVRDGRFTLGAQGDCQVGMRNRPSDWSTGVNRNT